MAGRKLVAGSALAGAAWWNIGTDKPWNPDKLPKAYDVPQIRDYWYPPCAQHQITQIQLQ